MTQKGLISSAFSMVLLFMAVSSFGQRSAITLVTFGNSTTAPRKGIEKVYPERIKEDLTALGVDIRVINAGVPSSHSGSITDNDFAKVVHAKDRFDTAVLKHHPDWVTINFGLNDSWQDKGIDGPSRVPVDDYRRNLVYYIDQIKKIDGKVILLTPNPIGSRFEPYREKTLKKYYNVVKKLARKKRVASVDSWKLFNQYARSEPKGIDVLLPDGIHPNDAGHELIAKEIEKIILKKYK